MLTVEKLTDYLAVCRLLSILNDKLETGRPDDVDDVRETLAELCRRIEPEIPVIKGIIAQLESAERLYLAQRAAGGRPAPYPAPANDHHNATPTHPAPSLA